MYDFIITILSIPEVQNSIEEISLKCGLLSQCLEILELWIDCSMLKKVMWRYTKADISYELIKRAKLSLVNKSLNIQSISIIQ